MYTLTYTPREAYPHGTPLHTHQGGIPTMVHLPTYTREAYPPWYTSLYTPREAYTPLYTSPIYTREAYTPLGGSREPLLRLFPGSGGSREPLSKVIPGLGGSREPFNSYSRVWEALGSLLTVVIPGYGRLSGAS